MKRPSYAALGILSAVAIGGAACDREPPAAPPPTPAAAAAGSTGPDLTYQDIVELISNPDHFAVARTLGERLPTLGPGSIPAMKEVLEDSASLELDGVDVELLMRYWAIHDPAAATWYAFTQVPRAYQVAAIHATLRPWAKADPESAVKTARGWTMGGGDLGAAAQMALVRGWYESGKPGVEEYIHGIGVGFDRQRAIAAYATAVIRAKGAQALIDWAEALRDVDDQYKLEVNRGVGPALVPFDLAAARRFCDAHCDGPLGSNVRSRIAARWSQKDGPAAMEWIGTAPPSDDTNTAIRFTYAVWSRREPEKAISWMEAKRAATPRPAWLEPITPVFARELGKLRPLDAIAVTPEIKGPVERDSVTVQVLRGWRQRDETAAEAWLAKSSLSPALLEQIRAPKTKLEQIEEEERARREKPAQAPS
jgi:hypothetical protein